MRDSYRVLFEDTANIFVVYKPNVNITFVQSPEGLYYHNMGGQRALATFNEEANEERGEEFTPARDACARLAR